MKLNLKRKSSVSKPLFLESSLKDQISYDLYKKIISEINQELCKLIVDRVSGITLGSLGRWIITKHKGSKKVMYSGPKKGKKIYNLHSLGMIWTVDWIDNSFLKHRTIYKMRAHRQNIKIPLYDKIMSKQENYYRKWN